MGDEPVLPQPPGDPEQLRRLREEARRRMDAEQATPIQSTVYGGPPIRPEDYGPAPVYGGPPTQPIAPTQRGPAPVYGGPPLRRKNWRWLLLALVGLLAAAVAWLLTHPNPFVNPAAVYGGPPVKEPPPPGILLGLQWLARKLR